MAVVGGVGNGGVGECAVAVVGINGCQLSDGAASETVTFLPAAT